MENVEALSSTNESVEYFVELVEKRAKKLAFTDYRRL